MPAKVDQAFVCHGRNKWCSLYSGMTDQTINCNSKELYTWRWIIDVVLFFFLLKSECSFEFPVICFVMVGHKALYGKGSQTFLAGDPQNNDARDRGPASTLEVAYNVVHRCTNTLLGRGGNRQRPHDVIFSQYQSHDMILSRYIINCDFLTFLTCKSFSQYKTLSKSSVSSNMIHFSVHSSPCKKNLLHFLLPHQWAL